MYLAMLGRLAASHAAVREPFHESVLAEGQASQTGSLRWEDYTNIVVDPSDDCTFWFVGNYLKSGAASSTKPDCPI